MIGPEQIEQLITPYRAAVNQVPEDSAALGQGGSAVLPVNHQSPGPVPDWDRTYERLMTYLDLILKWNARTNLTAIREPEEIVQRHFGESLFVGSLPQLGLTHDATVLDFGSGGGFPGVPMHILCPDLRMTLAESQGKKAAFLREAVRILGTGSEVWAGRVEAMAQERRFDVVAMRAVDHMSAALTAAAGRARKRIAVISTYPSIAGLDWPPVGFLDVACVPLPRSRDGIVAIARREDESLFHVEQ